MYKGRVVTSCVLWIALFGAFATEVRGTTLNLMDFGAVGNGTTDDGPALQSALNALAAAGGGTLIVPEGRYAIITPVSKDFTGLATSITIQGVESTTLVDSTGSPPELAKGLDLKSEFRPKTGSANIAIKISGLQSFLIKDIAFMGTNNVPTDAQTTLWLEQVEQATVRHCEFYGLSTIVHGAIIMAVRSGLLLEQSKFLGSVTNSGNYASVVQNIEWKSVVVKDVVFLDYGLRGELYGKTGYGAPYSWINIGNPKKVVNNEPRREVSIRRVFLDEGGFIGISSLPYRNEMSPPPIDLIYITNLRMNVSNLQTHGHYFTGVESLLIEKSRYQWSHNAISAINLIGVRRHAIIDRSEFVDHAYRIMADAATKRLSVINSIYTHLDSQAQTTRAFSTATPEEDPVQFVRQQFETVLGREPDPAAHYYWSDLLLRCDGDTQCVANVEADLDSYLGSTPSPTFSIQGLVKDENGNPVSGVAVALTGSQAVTTQSDANGHYSFSNLPTSGIYTLTPSKTHYVFGPVGAITTPSGDQVVDMAGTLNRHTLRGRITTSGGKPAANVTVTLSGSQSSATTTDANGDWEFPNIPAGGNYTVTPSQSTNVFSPAHNAAQDLSGDRTFNFTLLTYFINGYITRANGNGVSGVAVALSGSKTAATTTDPSGNYVFTELLAGGNYVITPTKAHTSFTPPTQTINGLAANQTASFTASTVTYTISGKLTSGGADLGGVTVKLSGSAVGTSTTGSDGSYSFSVAAEGNYTITPSNEHDTFVPQSQTINNLISNKVFDFVGTLKRHKLSGRVSRSNNQGVAGVTVTLSGSQNGVTTTDVNGDWAFLNIPAGGNYTLTPSQSTNVFSPGSSTVQNLSSDHTFNFTLVTYLINGWITRANGAGVSGVAVALSGSKTAATTTDSSGNYVFTELPAGGNYVVTPTRPHSNFAPANRTISGLAANQTASFTASNVSYTVRGRITSEGAGLNGVTVGLSGSATATTTTGPDGSYSFSVAAEGNYTVTPLNKHYTFAPQSQTISNLISDKVFDFIGTLKRHKVSGRVSNPSNQGAAGVTVTLSGSQTGSATTNSNGEFSFTNLPSGGTFSVAPAFPYHSFTPQNKTYVALDADQNVSFLMEVRRHTLSGRVRTGNGLGVSGVTVALSGFQNGSTTTDAGGNYSFVNLPAGQDYTLTVSKTAYTFTPPSAAFSQLDSNKTADFTAVGTYHAITGRITVGSFAMSAVSVSLSGSQTATALTDANGNFQFVVPESGSYTVTPTHSRYAFTPGSSSINNLTSDVVTNFTAKIKPGVPILISHSNTTRGLVLDALLGLTEPFDLSYDFPWSSDRRTRLTLFTTNFALQPGEALTAITADVEDGAHRIYPLTVEYFGKVDEVPWLNRVVVRLNDDLGEVGDVLIRISYRGVPSNRVRVGIGKLGGGPPDDPGSFPTPGSPPN